MNRFCECLKFFLLFALVAVACLEEAAVPENCKTHEGLDGQCLPRCKYPPMADSHGEKKSLSICKTFRFFNLVCCPKEDGYISKLKNLVKDCGKKQLVSRVKRIVGGKVSRKNEWPWMAVIARKYGKQEFTCGGAIISDRYILTAANCFVRIQRNIIGVIPSVVRIAEADLKDKDEGFEFEIADVIIHREYSTQKLLNDIALLKVQRKIIFNSKVQPICLPLGLERTENIENRTATVIGWGSQSFGGEGSSHLREVQVPIVSDSICYESYREHSQISKPKFNENARTVCAGERDGGRDACTGDSGGPLMLMDRSGKWTVFGISSGGYQCAAPNYPGIYTRVTEFLQWVAENID